MDEKTFEEKNAEIVVEEIVRDVKPFLETLKGAIKAIQKVLIFDRVLTYEEIMKYFLEHKGDNPVIVKGGLLKEETKDGYLVTQIFFDKDNKMVDDKMGRPLGCKRRVKKLDNELLNLFKNETLVIVE